MAFREVSLIDTIVNLNNQTDTSAEAVNTDILNDLVAANETIQVADSATITTSTVPTWDNGNFGHFVWS